MPAFSPDDPGVVQGNLQDVNMYLSAIITQPLPDDSTPIKRRQLLDANLLTPAIDAAAGQHRNLLQQSSLNYIDISPLTIPSYALDSNDIYYFNYDSFTGTPDYVELTRFEYGTDNDFDAAFTVSGSGVATNCVSSAANPAGVECPSSGVYTFVLEYVGPAVPGNVDVARNRLDYYNVTLSFNLPSASVAGSVVLRETYQVDYNGIEPFYITADRSAGQTPGGGLFFSGRRLQQV